MKLGRFIAMIVAAAMVVMTGCNDDDKQVEDDRTAIMRYLTSSHSPRLISQEDVPNSLEYNPHFYQRVNIDLYRYISTYYDAGRDEKAEVERGDEVELTFTAYIFSGRTPSADMIYYTNDAASLDKMKELGLDILLWNTEPLRIKIGTTNIIKGVENSLIGCREGDVVEAYMTYEQAYGKKDIGVVPKHSPVMWLYTINSVKKN